MEHQITVTDIKIRQSVMYITLKPQEALADPKIDLICRDIDKVSRFPFLPAENKKGFCTASVNLHDLDLKEGDWDITVRSGSSGQIYSTVLGGRIRAKLLLGNYRILKGRHIIFPMGSTGKRFILRCRVRTPYDHFFFRFRDLCIWGICRILRPFMKQRRLWLIYEKYCISAQDNGFYFFRYCMESLPEKEKKHIYFILDKNSAQWDAVRKYKKNVIRFMSFRHIFYMLTANLYAASDSRIHAYVWQPMPNLVSREINRHDILFLQHGVLALKRVENVFGRDGACPVTYFLTSSEFEQKIVAENFGYDTDHAPVLGLARWDVLTDKSRPDRPSILVMPTWRSWLEDREDSVFCSSEYYLTYMHLLKNQELLELLRESGARLIFYIHPKLREFMKDFHADNPRIQLVSFGETALNKLIMECSMLITDYSSVCWDFYYQEKPVVFYQFDMELYEQTNGSYIDMKHDLFGDRCTKEPELIETVRDYLRNGFHEKEKYGNMRKKYLPKRDHENCKRIYEYIIKKGY